jgi:hypothetical protein
MAFFWNAEPLIIILLAQAWQDHLSNLPSKSECLVPWSQFSLPIYAHSVACFSAVS